MKFHERMDTKLAERNLTDSPFFLKIDNYLYTVIFERKWHKSVEVFMKVISRMGDGYVWIFCGLLFFIFKQSHAVYFFLRALVGALACIPIFILVKNTVHRTRPFHMHTVKAPLLKPPDKYSFPSGHTMVAFSMIFTAGMADVAFLIPVAVLAFLVALSRVFVGVHYPLDVIGGAIMGSVMGILTDLGFALIVPPPGMLAALFH